MGNQNIFMIYGLKYRSGKILNTPIVSKNG